MKLKNYFAAALLVSAVSVNAQTAKINVAVDQPGHKISPTLWGIFFEDINLSADGGIYPELVRNRSFEDADKPADWNTTGAEAAIDESKPLNPFNRRSLRLKVNGGFTVENRGYWGMNAVKGDSYTFKFAARVADGFNSPLTVKLIGADGKLLASGKVSVVGGNWIYRTVTLTPTENDTKARLEISGDGKGTLFLDMVSLLPDKTWKDHGLRPDLAEAISALQPSFLRFPGGCWVEGDTMDKMYDWKKTVGNVDVRTPLWNIWQYYATHSLGYHEYLQLAEDLGAEPLFDINCGMSHKENIPMDLMTQWVQDALDAIEYANGPTNTLWGGWRARNGHPAPFNLKYLEIGNENGGPAYHERWALFVAAIKAKHPEITLVANHWAGGYPKTPMPEMVDEHYYDTPEWFLRHAHQYDQYDRKGPKIFVGEYAVTRNGGLGNLRAAIGEAAFMTGIERNSDVVTMACYAPLFCNANHKRWPVNLINFDSSTWFGLPGYYVQKLFSEHRGDVTLPANVESPVSELSVSGGMIGVGTWNTAAEFKDIQVTAPDGKVLFESDFTKGTRGWKLLGAGADWRSQDGVLRQGAEREFIRALAGKREWTDYTLSLKARKISGSEGFLVLFRIGGNEDRTWWNIGGWGNTAHGIEAGETLDSKPGFIETGRWYDLKVVVHGKNVKCYLDGQMIHDLNYDAGGKVTSLYAAAATEEKTGDIIVKVVNANPKELETEIHFSGTSNLTGKGTAIVLTSESPTDENTLQEPTKVSPKMDAVNFTGTTLKRVFPGNSFTVLRLQTK
jgi:alpha-L-arabinofuranosidase